MLSLLLPIRAKPLFLRSALRPAWSIFWDGTVQAYSLTLAEKLRAGNFASLVAQRREPVRLGQNRILLNRSVKDIIL